MTADAAHNEEALIRSIYTSALRLWLYAGEPDAPLLPNPFETADALSVVREMLESLIVRRAPRANIAEMARTSTNEEQAKFYRRILARKDGREAPSDRPAFAEPLEEAGLLRGIIGLTLTTMPDDVVIEFNRAAWASSQALHRPNGSPSVEEDALLFEMEWYGKVMDMSGVTERYAAQAKLGAH